MDSSWGDCVVGKREHGRHRAIHCNTKGVDALPRLNVDSLVRENEPALAVTRDIVILGHPTRIESDHLSGVPPLGSPITPHVLADDRAIVSLNLTGPVESTFHVGRDLRVPWETRRRGRQRLAIEGPAGRDCTVTPQTLAVDLHAQPIVCPLEERPTGAVRRHAELPLRLWCRT